jgi:hypothetical protein
MATNSVITKFGLERRHLRATTQLQICPHGAKALSDYEFSKACRPNE